MSTEVIVILALTWASLCVVLICAYAIHSANGGLKKDVRAWRDRVVGLHDELNAAHERIAVIDAEKRKLSRDATDLMVKLVTAPALPYTVSTRVQPHHDATGKTTSLTLDLVIARDGVTKFVEVRRLAASKKSRDELTAVAAKINLAAKEMSA